MNPLEESHVSGDSERARIIEEAAVWFAQMHGGKPTPGDRSALKTWLAADTRHAEAYADMSRLWEGAVDLPGLKKRQVATRAAVTRRRVGKALILGAVGLGTWRFVADFPFADYRTGIGERRSVTLPDGSIVDIAAETRLSLAFKPDRRGLVLHDGEAFFSVAKDDGRPFVVESGSGQAIARGTAFGVCCRDNRTTVVVTEHSVDVAIGAAAVRVSAGSLVSYERNRLGTPREADAESELAWREGRLVFAQAAFGDVVQALNRWRSGHLLVVSPALLSRPVTLIVNLDRMDGIVSQLAQALPIRVVDVTPYMTLIFSA